MILTTDVDECLFEIPVCDANANCTNVYGSYNCSCNTGFTGNGFVCNGMPGHIDVIQAVSFGYKIM